MTRASRDYLEAATFVGLHVERARVGWRGRRRLRRALRALRARVPEIQLRYDTVRRYR